MQFSFPSTTGWHSAILIDDEEERQRLLTVLKRGANTLSPPDMGIVNLIRAMEDDRH